jgi:hypothetical protein
MHEVIAMSSKPRSLTARHFCQHTTNLVMLAPLAARAAWQTATMSRVWIMSSVACAIT